MIQKSLSQVLKSLEPVGKADDVYSVASSERINAIQDALRLLARGENIVSGTNVKKVGSDGYAVISGKTPRLAAGTGKPGPFEIEIQGQDFYKVRPGTLNDMLPGNIFLEQPYDLNATTYVVLHAETDQYHPTNANIISLNTPPNPPGIFVNVAPATFDVIIGIIAFGAVYQVVDYNLNATPNDVIHTLTEEPDVGRPYYDINYSWKIESV